MKNEKTMLALILVAALAMVSVAGVALASESSDAIIITPTKTIVGADETYEGPLSVAAYDTGAESVLIINGTYTGTVSFYNVDPESADAEPFATVVCNAVSGVTFTNVYTGATNSTVTVDGTQTGAVTLTSGAVTLGNSTTSYMGTLTVSTYGTIVSGMTYGATVAIVAATSSVAEHVEVSSVIDSDINDFESSIVGITNEMLGNDIAISYDSENTKYVITGALAKIDLTGASAIGTILKSAPTSSFAADDTYGYGIIVDGTFVKADVSSTGVVSFDSSSILAGYDVSGLTTVDSSTGSVTGITGAIEFNLDFTANGVTINTTAISNGAVTVSAASSVDGTFINNGALTLKANVTGSGQIISKGTFSSVSTTNSSVTCEPNVSGYYTIVTSTDNTKVTTTGYATLAEALEAAGSTGTVYVGGFVYLNENVTVGAEQTIQFQGKDFTTSSTKTAGLFAVDGTSSVIINGEAINYSGVPMIIASEASMDISEADITAGVCADYPLVPINVNGKLTVLATQMNDMLITNFGLVSADTVSGTTTLTFDNLYNALTNTTTAKSTVTLLRGVILNKSATLATDVTFDNAGFGLTIAEDVVLTADGHFQFVKGTSDVTLNIKGMLIINDDTEPAIDTTSTGSFIGTEVDVTLTGGIQVSEGAKFLNEADFTITADAGVISVEGTFTNKGDIGHSMDNDLLLALNIAANGAVVNGGTIYAKIAAISGTFTNYVGDNSDASFIVTELAVLGTLDNTSGTVTVNEIYVTGTVKAGTAGITVNSLAGFGTASTPLASTAVTGTITLGNEAYAIVYGSALTSKIFAATVVSTDFIIDDEVYATEYATESGTTPTTTVLLDLLTVDISGKKLVGWYDSPDFNGKMITVNNKAVIGEYVAVYGNLVDKTVTVSFAYTQNGTWVLDGQNIGASGNITLAVGTHTIAFVADNGYELSNYAVTVNQVTISSTSYNFQNDTNAVAYSGEVKEKSTDGGLDLVTILLIIITIVIIIMAIIIALKLMRS